MKTNKFYILEKQKLIDPMDVVFAITRIRRKSFMENLKMANSKGKDNFILQVEIIIWVNLSSTKKMEGGCINGLANNPIYMKVNFKKVKEMAGERFGGQMEAGMKDSLEMEFKVVMEYCIEKEDIKNMKDLGIMECLTGKELNILKMVKDIKGLSSKINFMEKGYFTKTIQ